MEEYKVEVDENGTERWYQNKQLHRTDGPAIIYQNGHKNWYQNNQLHRTDGPAIIRPDEYKAWYINGKEYTENEFNMKMNEDSCDGKVVDIDGKKYRLNEVK